MHNARATLSDYLEVGDDFRERFTAGKDGMLWFYHEVISALSAATPPPRALPLLQRTVEELLEQANA